MPRPVSRLAVQGWHWRDDPEPSTSMSDAEPDVFPVPFEIEVVRERLVAAFAAGELEDWGKACVEMKKLLRKHRRDINVKG